MTTRFKDIAIGEKFHLNSGLSYDANRTYFKLSARTYVEVDEQGKRVTDTHFNVGSVNMSAIPADFYQQAMSSILGQYRAAFRAMAAEPCPAWHVHRSADGTRYLLGQERDTPIGWYCCIPNVETMTERVLTQRVHNMLRS